jgi:hypothetical protein
VGVSPGFSPGTGTDITGAYTIDGGELADTASSTLFDSFAINAWQETIAIQDDGSTPILTPEIGGSTFTPGTWRSGNTLAMSTGTTVTLDGQGDRNSKFLFQVDTSMLVAAGCKIVLINGAKAENVVWAIGTMFTSGAGVDFKGSIMAGTAVTLGAANFLEGSILALTAVTLGAENQVKGCIVALSAIAFGPANYVSVVVKADTVIDFPLYANANDKIIVACMPLIEEAPAACDGLPVDADMELMLNACTQQGISNAILAARAGTRRTSRSHIPHVEGHIRMLPTDILGEQGGRRARTRSLRGARQGERRMRTRICHTTDPSELIKLLCCGDPNAYTFCGSPTNDERRRELVEIDGVAKSETKISAGQVEQYLPYISLECTRNFKALAESYIGIDQNAECFAAATDVPLLKCSAILVTGGDILSEEEHSEL